MLPLVKYGLKADIYLERVKEHGFHDVSEHTKEAGQSAAKTILAGSGHRTPGNGSEDSCGTQSGLSNLAMNVFVQ